VDEALLRILTPTVIAVLVRRGAEFAAAEDAVQDALVEALRVWPDNPPQDRKAWLVTVAWRKFLDLLAPTPRAAGASSASMRNPHRSRGRRWTTPFSSIFCALTRR
jgi:predicted RNA polymerase sigma factor